MQIKIILCCLWFLCTASFQAQQSEISLEGILHRHIQAFGDQNTRKDIQTMRITGTYICGGYEYPITILRKRPNLCRIEVQRAGRKDVCVYDGQKTWRIVDGDVQDIEDPLYYCTMLAFSNFDILPDYKANGISIEYMGQEKFEGKSTHKLQVDFNGKKTEKWYINSATYRLVKVEGMTRWYTERTAKKTILYMDYKAVDGVYLPHYVYSDITTFSTEVEVEEVEINPELDPDLFRTPVR